MEYVYPKIKEYCREKHGLEYQVVDMRWGVRDEMTDEHMTTALCMNELRGCQKYSMGPNCIYFGAQKYRKDSVSICMLCVISSEVLVSIC